MQITRPTSGFIVFNRAKAKKGGGFPKHIHNHTAKKDVFEEDCLRCAEIIEDKAKEAKRGN